MPHVETPCRYERLIGYPHLGPEDAAIWDRFIAANPARFERVWYDFRVGDEPDVPEESPAGLRQCWWDLSYWRIDVVAEDAEAIYIIEIKPRANAKALGQAEGYADVYEEDEQPAKPVKAVVLTDIIIPTTQRIADRHGVLIWQA